MFYQRKPALGSQAKQEPADSEGRNGTKLVFQASNSNRWKLHQKALTHEYSHTKWGFGAQEKDPQLGWWVLHWILLVRLREMSDTHRVRNGKLQTSANNVAVTSVSLQAAHNKCLRAPCPPPSPPCSTHFLNWWVRVFSWQQFWANTK